MGVKFSIEYLAGLIFVLSLPVLLLIGYLAATGLPKGIRFMGAMMAVGVGIAVGCSGDGLFGAWCAGLGMQIALNLLTRLGRSVRSPFSQKVVWEGSHVSSEPSSV